MTATGRPQLRALTGSRYFAALAVLLFHFGRFGHLPWILFSLGRQAVSLFFILSGLVLTYAYHQAVSAGTVRWTGYVRRRLARILPLHLVSLAIATFVYWKLEPRTTALSSWLANLLCVQVYWPAATIALHWNAPSWSISCELFFYALFPVVLTWLVRGSNAPRRLIATLLAIYALEATFYFVAARYISASIANRGVFLGFAGVSGALTNILPLVPVLRIGEFFIGICLGLLVIGDRFVLFRRSPSLRNGSVLLCLAAVLALQKAPLYKLGETVVRSADYILYVPVFALFLLALACGRTFLSPLLEHPFVVLLGEASYSLYLLHYPLAQVLLGDRSLSRYLIAFAAINVAAVLSFLYIEKPLMRAFAGNRPRHVEPTTLEQSQF